LPDIGEGITEAELVAWHVQVGETVLEDAPLVDVMTEKATVEIPSPRTGKVLSIAGEPGDKLRVGAELVVLECDAETKPAPTKPAPESRPAPGPASSDTVVPAAPPAATEVGREVPPPPVASRGVAPAAQQDRAAVTPPAAAGAGKPLASPAVRRRAQALGLSLASVRGSGPGGRIGHADLDALLSDRRARLPAVEAPGQPRRPDIEEVKIIGLRRRIAERMQESKRRIPHYSYVEELDATSLEELRRQLNAQHGTARPRLTLLPFLIRAVVRAVRRFPAVNALFDDEAGIVRRYRAVHVGIATQTEQGLMVPVLRHAETLGLWGAAAEVARLAAAARNGKATLDELTGSTITITSLGPLGGIVSTPVINHPEVAIIGVNRIARRPVVRGEQIVVREMMNLSSSFDHRVVDGWNAAEFVQELKRLLEQPASLFVE
jgi:2-oxoisovalerate dehydrogenase E2 component (dihydrolipoyl transacylase)